MRSGFKIFLLLLGLALSAMAYAQAEERFDSGWYVGGGLALNDVYTYDQICPWCYGSSIYGDSDTGIALAGGLRINNYLAVEGAYYGASTMGWDEGIVFDEATLETYLLDADIELSSWQISLLGILAGRKWEGYLRIGLAMWNAQADQTLIPSGTGPALQRTLDIDGEDVTIGMGFGRSFGENWQWRFDYGFFAIDDELLGVGGSENAYSDAMALQVLWRMPR